MAKASKRQLVLELLKSKSVIRAPDVADLGVTAGYLSHLARNGYLVRIDRGGYTTPDRYEQGFTGVVRVAAYAPGAVICLLSALRFHGVGTRSPDTVWIALPPNAWVPRIGEVGLTVVRMAPGPMEAGVETHVVDGITVRVFGVAKTIADCFRFRRLVGIDTAVEALRQALLAGLVKQADLYEPARVDRIWTVLEPYLEALQ